MNYIRGAVSAISAPYQYYKELPPLNPSTLTGAIDVIVVSRPTEDGNDTELVCSPFHVRFGKWQVLRPADKKVNLTVNGRPIPFNMKIGEAGEAFFIFETAGDVPEDLITSPLLSAVSSPNLEAQEENIQAGRFGAKAFAPGDQVLFQDQPGGIGRSQEPDFLDLDASSRKPSTNKASGISLSKPDDGSSSEVVSPSTLLARTTDISSAVVDAVVEIGTDKRRRLKDEANAIYNMANNASPLAGDEGSEALPQTGDRGVIPEPIYNEDVVIDMEGYHSHGIERSDRTITSKAEEEEDSSLSTGRTPGPSRSPSPVTYGPSSSSPTISASPIPFPNIRATSEPPPDSIAVAEFPAPVSSHTRHESRPNSLRIPTEEYMWEWGAFPQKSPMNTKSEMPESDNPSWKEREMSSAGPFIRSPTPPAATLTSSSLPREGSLSHGTAACDSESNLGIGGRLRPDREDPYLFTLFIETKAVQFELSIVTRGIRSGDDELETAEIFNEGKIDFWKFLDDEQVLNDENLVLRWGGDRYITRSDGSPLMGVLSKWREATLRDNSTRSTSRSPSPSGRKQDGEQPSSGSTRPSKQSSNTRTSWVRWWRRSRREGSSGTRPEFRETSSAPPETIAILLKIKEEPLSLPNQESPPIVRLPSASSAPPAMVADETSDNLNFPETGMKSKTRYAKTLRLTSEQLKLLDLKPGANTVTFSLSTTGVAACTARIFVWDHTDMIVVSDIDGTITKSDALGHVFTLIGRDWTHLGVAKLYTDICRNGYKIMYLTSRAIGQADSTRYYLKGVKQNDYQLPEGPVIMSPDRLMASLHREVIMRKPEVFKMACLRDIRRLFGKTSINPFYSGFGNRITDALSYRSVDVPSSRIFTIDSAGEVKMELLELAGYKSSYIHMTDLVDQMFPPIHRKFNSHFTDFNYWKQPLQEYELPDQTPPSPALSARSDTSTQSTLARLRNLSLMGTRANHVNRLSLPPPATESTGQDRQDGTRDSHLRQMSSFERLSNRLSAFAPSSSSTAASPSASSSTFFDSGDEDEGGDDGDLEKQTQWRPKARRESMPGSLPGSAEGSDEEMCLHEDDSDEGDNDYGSGGEHEDEAAEQAFDEDLFAAGEMENVPFL